PRHLPLQGWRRRRLSPSPVRSRRRRSGQGLPDPRSIRRQGSAPNRALPLDQRDAPQRGPEAARQRGSPAGTGWRASEPGRAAENPTGAAGSPDPEAGSPADPGDHGAQGAVNPHPLAPSPDPGEGEGNNRDTASP